MVARGPVIETRLAPTALLLSLARNASAVAHPQFFQVSSVRLYRRKKVDHFVNRLAASGDRCRKGLNLSYAAGQESEKCIPTECPTWFTLIRIRRFAGQPSRAASRKASNRQSNFQVWPVARK